MQILILGMHRSGTSIVARLLNMMGAYFAPEGVSTGASAENPKGFWERRDVRALNDMLLQSAGADWDRLSSFSRVRVPKESAAHFKKEAGKIILAMDAHRPWFLKEPRLCVLAPLWLDLLELPVCVIVYRSPLEVARSLEMRNEFSPAFSLALWERYNVAALNATRGRRRIQVNHADLMAKPVATARSLARALETLGVRGLRAPSDEEILAFIDPSLYRAKETEVAVSQGLSASQRALSKAFRSGKALLAKKGPRFSAGAQGILSWHDETVELEKRNAVLSEEALALKGNLERTAEEFVQLRKKLETQAGAIERRDQWRESAKKKIADLTDTISQQREAIERRNQWRENAEKQIAELKSALSLHKERAEKQIAELKSALSHQKEAIERRNQWRENAEKQIAELRSAVSHQEEAIARHSQWRENAEKQIVAMEKAGYIAVARLEKRLSEKDAAIERRDNESKTLNAKLQRVIGHQQDLERQLASEIRNLQEEKTALRKLRELLKKAAAELDRARKSSRWKVGSIVLFRSSKTKGPSAHEKYVGGFDAWRKQQKANHIQDRSDSGEKIPPTECGSSIAGANGPVPVAPVAPPKVETFARQPMTEQIRSFREFDLESIDRIAGQLSGTISIIVPVYNSPAELRRCLDSIFLHTQVPFELILVDDCSPDPAIGALIRQYESHHGLRVIRNPVNQGFVHSVNVGIQASQHDVVLLNCDTEVTPRWLQKLMIAAYSDPKVASVTPFSNAAGAFSVPQIGVNSPIPFPFTVLKMARLTERLSSCTYPKVPTGNGFCMYIKRQALNEIGLLDEVNFGRGYGEENDFCMRARKAGWRHIIDDSLFIFHRGNSSFGEEKKSLLKEHREILDRLHPEYTGLVREFTNSTSINALRHRIGERLKAGAGDLHLDKPRLLFILHQGSGGVPMTNDDLVSKVSETYQCFLLTSTGSEIVLGAWEDGRTVEKRRWKLPGSWSAQNYRNPAARQVYFQVLAGLGIDLVHIRHLFKHSFDAPELCRSLRIPVVLSFHDYYFACPSIHLLDQNEVYCGGECTPGLQQCTIPSPMLRDLPMLKTYLPEWRGRVAELLQCVDAFVTTADSVKAVYLSAFPQLDRKPFWVIEHGRNFERLSSVASAPSAGQPARILCAGNIDSHKGSYFIRRLSELDTDGLLEFHFLGQTNEELRDIGVHHGAYKRADFPKLARKIQPAFAGIFSIWAETYSHTLSEAWSVGLPVLGSKLGAVGERISRNDGGWTIDTADAAGALAQIRQIIRDPQGYRERVQAVERIEVPTVEEMANAYEALYSLISSKDASPDLVRVGCVVPSGDRGSTFIRVRLPLAHEKTKRRILAMCVPSRGTIVELRDWIARLNLRTILLQREVLNPEAAVQLIETCRARGVRVVFEIDDNLLDVDESHPECALYASKAKAIRYLDESADRVVVSTPNLQKLFGALNKHTVVIGNTLDEWLWFSPERPPVRSTPPDTIIAGYMGTKTHRADLEMVREPFLRARDRLLRDRGIQLLLQLVGGIDEKEFSPQHWYERLAVPSGHASYPRFVRWLRGTVSWDFALAPLVLSSLNQSKSALKFLEYTGLGVPGIFSNLGEYGDVIQDQETGLLIDSNCPGDWEEAIVKLASSPPLRERLSLNARKRVLERYILGKAVPRWVSLVAESG
jgi:GT2 family glycosyltransferase